LEKKNAFVKAGAARYFSSRFDGRALPYSDVVPMISAGQKIPLTLRLKVLQRNDEKEVKLSELLAKPTIFSVYMRNNTGGCDKQNDSLVQHAAGFAKAGYNLVALSRDTLASHRKYAVKKGITYVLASDPEDVFARATDSIVEKSMYGKKFTGPARAAYVVGRDGTVLAVVPKVDTTDHGAQLQAVLTGLK
jgi:peroxiredoxin Q/BCP